jgi:hypothetical protein
LLEHRIPYINGLPIGSFVDGIDDILHQEPRRYF